MKLESSMAALAKNSQKSAEKLFTFSLFLWGDTQEKGKNELYSTIVKLSVVP